MTMEHIIRVNGHLYTIDRELDDGSTLVRDRSGRQHRLLWDGKRTGRRVGTCQETGRITSRPYRAF